MPIVYMHEQFFLVKKKLVKENLLIVEKEQFKLTNKLVKEKLIVYMRLKSLEIQYYSTFPD